MSVRPLVEDARSDDEERSFRLLQPRLVVLYMIAKKGKVRNNISEISRLLKYQKDSWTHNMIHSLLDAKYIEPKLFGEVEYLVLTKSGRRKIAPLTLSRYFLPLILVILSLIPISWAFDETLGIPVTPLPLFVAGIGFLVVSVFLWYETGVLERDFFDLG